MIVEKLICRYLSNDLSFNDKLRLRKWLNKAEHNESILSDYSKIWEVSAILKKDTEIKFDAQEGWSMLQEKIFFERDKDMEDNDTQIDIDDFPQGIRDFISDQN